MINVDSIISEHFPRFLQKKPLISNSLVSLPRMLCHEREFQKLERQYPYSQGRLVIVSNHPIGGFTGYRRIRRRSGPGTIDS